MFVRVIVAALIAVVAPNIAAAKDCGVYVVGEGETLGAISRKIYGAAVPPQLLFSANSAALVANSGVPAPGMRLTAPCIEGGAINRDVLEREAAAPAATPAPAAETSSGYVMDAPGPVDIRVVTADAWRPYTDANDPAGGMLTEVIDRALDRVAAQPSHRIDFVNDWGAHLDPLLSNHLYDFSIAWVRPKCETTASMDPESRFRCERLAWSEPVFEIVSQLYVDGAVDARALTRDDLEGRTICIPEGYTLTGLAQNDLMEPFIRLSRPREPVDCVREVQAGASDATFLTISVAESAIAQAGLQGALAEAPQIFDIQTLHAVISVNHPRRDPLLAAMNDGIRTIRENGEWFEIVQRHLVKHAAATR